MFTALLKFEGQFFSKRKLFYFSLIAFLLLGLLIAARGNLSFPNTYRNSPFTISYFLALTSLLGIFLVTILCAQTLFREGDARFDHILYATPLRKIYYLAARFMAVFIISLISFIFLIAGMMAAHAFLFSKNELLPFTLKSYLIPFLYIVLPNLFLFTCIICSIGWISRNKLTIYIAGLLIYFLYIGVSLFANAPMMATSAKLTAEGMSIASKIDPFGLSAFFEQTRLWTSVERNNQQLSFSGNLLINRIGFVLLSIVFLISSYLTFKFRLSKSRSPAQKHSSTRSMPGLKYQPVLVNSNSRSYFFQSFLSFARIDLKSIFKGISFKLIVLSVLSLVAIEIYSEIDGSLRFPDRFASTSLVVNRILSAFPMVGLLVILFYAAEVYYASKAVRFDSLEDVSPAETRASFLSKWLALAIIPNLLLVLTIAEGIVFQLLYDHPSIDWFLYVQLFYIVGLPLALSAGFILVMHRLIRNKYVGLTVSALLLILLQSSFASMAGLNHPLLTIAKPFAFFYSDMNGFGAYMKPFHWQMAYWSSLLLLLIILTHIKWRKGILPAASPQKRNTAFRIVLLSLVFTGAGLILYSSVIVEDKKELVNWKEAYERKYRSWAIKKQPTITSVKTSIHLYPGKNAYRVYGEYSIQNKSDQPIDTILVYAGKELQWSSLLLEDAQLLEKDEYFNHYIFKLKNKLRPLDSLRLKFDFSYSWNGFSQHDPFNSIINNGTFLRISNYYPLFGYQNSNEISDKKERNLRNLDEGSKVPALDAKRVDSAGQDFVELEMEISTDDDQTAIAVGELQRQWKDENRHHFLYKTAKPVPFRFAVASAKFAQTKELVNGVEVIAYYHPAHSANISHMLASAKEALTYLESSFAPYPFKTLRLVEISSFTTGFAGTAYPASFFITENFGFRSKAASDNRKDIINELVSHELSHSWWGNAMIAPDYREGSRILTETLAMYSELMVYKKTYGEQNLVERVNTHKQIYLSERGFAKESPLVKADPRHIFLCYDKGMYAMYRVYKLLGEEKTNAALRNLLAKFAYPKAPPVSTDLLNELYVQGDSIQRKKIHELFEEIVTYDIKLDSVRWTAGRLTVAAHVQKYFENGRGEKQPAIHSEVVNIEIIYPDNSKERLELSALNNRLDAVIKLKKKPLMIRLDPDGLLMDVSEEDNELEIE